MKNDIQVQYMVTRLGVSTGMPIAVLHIGECWRHWYLEDPLRAQEFQPIPRLRQRY